MRTSLFLASSLLLAGAGCATSERVAPRTDASSLDAAQDPALDGATGKDASTPVADAWLGDGGAGDASVPDGATPDAATQDGSLLKPVGAPCSQDNECAGGTCWTPASFGMPGGYCTQLNCTEGSCPVGSECFTFTGDTGQFNACVKSCTLPSHCRVDEHYTCDSYDTCWPLQAVGSSCQENGDCLDGTCLDETTWGLPGGYCSKAACTLGGSDCPADSSCFSVGDYGNFCLRDCLASADCRPEYVCGVLDECWVPLGVGQPCETDEQCAGGRCLDQFPGGYCTTTTCTLGGSDCPTGSACYQLGDASHACIQTCTDPSECRTAEDYTCDSYDTCWPLQAVGGQCQAWSDCLDGACFTTAPDGGYCTMVDCLLNTVDICPSNSSCFYFNYGEIDEYTACLKDCPVGNECRPDYQCMDLGTYACWYTP